MCLKYMIIKESFRLYKSSSKQIKLCGAWCYRPVLPRWPIDLSIVHPSVPHVSRHCRENAARNGLKFGMVMHILDTFTIDLMWVCQSVGVHSFNAILTQWNITNFVFTNIIVRMIGRNSPNCAMMMSQTWNPDYMFELKRGSYFQ